MLLSENECAGFGGLSINNVKMYQIKPVYLIFLE